MKRFSFALILLSFITLSAKADSPSYGNEHEGKWVTLASYGIHDSFEIVKKWPLFQLPYLIFKVNGSITYVMGGSIFTPSYPSSEYFNSIQNIAQTKKCPRVQRKVIQGQLSNFSGSILVDPSSLVVNCITDTAEQF